MPMMGALGGLTDVSGDSEAARDNVVAELSQSGRDLGGTAFGHASVYLMRRIQEAVDLEVCL